MMKALVKVFVLILVTIWLVSWLDRLVKASQEHNKKVMDGILGGPK